MATSPWMSLKPSTSVLPPTGWHIYDGGRRIDGSTKDDLILRLTNDRINNSRPLGNPEKDIDEYICEKYPSHCFEDRNIPTETVVPRTFRERVTAWAANRYSKAGAIPLVSQDIADKRAEICSQCPHNTEWKIGCPPCVASTERTLTLIRQNRKPERAVLGCNLMGHDNTTASFLPEPYLKHRKQNIESSPEFCWMRTL